MKRQISSRFSCHRFWICCSYVGTERQEGRAGEVAQQLKRSPHKCKEQSSDPQKPMQMPGSHGSQPVTLSRRQRQRILRASCLARLAVSAGSSFDWESLLQEEGRSMIEEDSSSTNLRLPNIGTHISMCTYIWAHTQGKKNMHLYMHIHTKKMDKKKTRIQGHLCFQGRIIG